MNHDERALARDLRDARAEIARLEAQIVGTQERENMFSRAVTEAKTQLAEAEAAIERVKDIRYGYVKAFPGSDQGYISHEDVLRALAYTEAHNG